MLRCKTAYPHTDVGVFKAQQDVIDVFNKHGVYIFGDKKSTRVVKINKNKCTFVKNRWSVQIEESYSGNAGL